MATTQMEPTDARRVIIYSFAGLADQTPANVQLVLGASLL